MSRRDALRKRSEARPRRGYLIALLPPMLTVLGCPGLSPPVDDVDTLPVFNNTADPSNGAATYVGSAACIVCHPETGEVARRHGHTHALKPIIGVAPQYPEEIERGGVPAPPNGRTWNNVSYVIGGYLHGALFVDDDGFLMTDGFDGTHTLWSLAFLATDTDAGFGPYRPEEVTPLPYEFDCFRCHTTAPQPQSSVDGPSQDGRLGILGTWAEAGVQCEGCHGPGGNHIPHPEMRDLYVDSSADACQGCHSADPKDPTPISVSDGFLNPNAQWSELRASGGHASFSCTVCHDPHVSVAFDRVAGIRNECTACHVDQTMARHGGEVFVRGAYVEELSCESCHMPFAGKSTTAAAPPIVGFTGRMGDVRTHVFRIDVRGVDFTAMVGDDGARVVTDESGRAAVTLDYVCLRCHTDEPAMANTAFPLLLGFAGEIAERIHEDAP